MLVLTEKKDIYLRGQVSEHHWYEVYGEFDINVGDEVCVKNYPRDDFKNGMYGTVTEIDGKKIIISADYNASMFGYPIE